MQIKLVGGGGVAGEEGEVLSGCEGGTKKKKKEKVKNAY